MEVTVKMNKIEVREYLDSDFSIHDDEYCESIQNDMVIILNKAGFQSAKLSDITVFITE